MDLWDLEGNDYLKGVRASLESIEKNDLFRCPECSHLLDSPPVDYHICIFCGVEFGYDAKERPEVAPLWRG